MREQFTTKAALSVDQFVEAIGIGRTMFYKLVGLGKIKVLKVGTRTLVPVGEVEAFLNSLEKASGSDR